jgi:hypothetical protein
LFVSDVPNGEKQKKWRERAKVTDAEFTKKERLRQQEIRKEAKNAMTNREYQQNRAKERLKKQKQREMKKGGARNCTGRRESCEKKKAAGKRRARRNREEERRDTTRAKMEAWKWRKKADALRKRLERLTKRRSDKCADSPRTLVANVLHQPKEVEKTLLLHYSLMSQMKSCSQKTTVAKILAGKLLKKYRLAKMFVRAAGVGIETIKRSLQRQTRSDKTPLTSVECIKEFFLRTDNSRITTGKNDTRTRKGVKLQRRILLDSLKNLCRKFQMEYPSLVVSQTLFTQTLPFNLTPPLARDRETCLCKRCDNAQLLADTLYHRKLLVTRDLEALTQQLHCLNKTKDCSWGKCVQCCNKKIVGDVVEDGIIQFRQWESVLNAHEHKCMKKLQKEDSLVNVVALFEKQIKELTKHNFVLRHQYRALRDIKPSLDETSVVVHVDFSENFMCKYSREVQSAHFGASHEQVSLHTGIIYASPNVTEPFCTISDSVRHDACGVWAHLTPVLKHIRSNYPNVICIHFWSDSPSSQYRNRKNMFLFSREIYSFGFTCGTWNFFEAGHGKGAPDGIGAALKRTADAIVSKGIDIPNATSFYHCMNGNVAIKLHFIPSEQVSK